MCTVSIINAVTYNLPAAYPPMGVKLDLPRRPRLRDEQRADLPWGDQLAECRWVAHLEDSLLSLLLLHRRAGSTLGTDILFSNRKKNLRVNVTGFPWFHRSSYKKTGHTSDCFCKVAPSCLCSSGWALKCLGHHQAVLPTSHGLAGARRFCCQSLTPFGIAPLKTQV